MLNSFVLYIINGMLCNSTYRYGMQLPMIVLHTAETCNKLTREIFAFKRTTIENFGN